MGRDTFSGSLTSSQNWLILSTSLILSGLGLITLLAMDANLFYRQAAFLGVSLVILVAFSRLNLDIVSQLASFIYAGCIVLLIATLVTPDVRGASRWLSVGLIQFQPSEIVKPFFIASLASLLTYKPPVNWRAIFIHFCLLFLPFVLIIRQPDLGNAIIYLSVWLAMIVLAGLPLRALIVGTVGLGVIIPLLYRLLAPYQKLRLVTFFNPGYDPQGAGYNAIQSLITVGSGRWFGRGFGRGTQSLLEFLPERHTDFIFAAYSETFGFLGALILLGIFFLFLYTTLKLAENSVGKSFALLFVVGVFMMVFTQVVVNVGMNMGLLPITGITLPFVSYGGSSLVSLYITLGLMLSLAGKRGRR